MDDFGPRETTVTFDKARVVGVEHSADADKEGQVTAQVAE